MKMRRGALVAVLIFAAAGIVGHSQQSPGTQPQVPPFPGLSQAEDKNKMEVPREVQERQEKARSSERQRRLVADTDKLLALATQLHEDVGKTDKNILSLDVVRRAEEIEKLARSVKERMRG